MRKDRDIPSHDVQNFYLNKKLHDDSISLQSEKGIIKTLGHELLVQSLWKPIWRFWERRRLKILQDPTELLGIYLKEFIY